MLEGLEERKSKSRRTLLAIGYTQGREAGARQEESNADRPG